MHPTFAVHAEFKPCQIRAKSLKLGIVRKNAVVFVDGISEPDLIAQFPARGVDFAPPHLRDLTAERTERLKLFLGPYRQALVVWAIVFQVDVWALHLLAFVLDAQK